MSKILNIITTWFTGIKWTSLKVSVIGNIILLIIIFFLFRGSETPEPEIIIQDRVIEIPGKDGKLDTVYLPTPISIVNPVNTELLSKYNSLKDTVAKLELFKTVIAEREYNEVYEDSIQKITIYTKVQGKLLKQAPKYQIKPSTITIKDTTIINYNKPPTNKLLLGIETGLPLNNFTKKETIDFNPVIKGSVYFQNKRSNIITIGFDSNETIWAGYIFKL